MVLGFEDDNVSDLEIRLYLLPLGPGLECLEVFLGPSSPEMVNDGLAVLPAFLESDLGRKRGCDWICSR